MSHRLLAAGACIALIALPAPVSASASLGRLDPAYGRGGLSMTSLGVAGEVSDVELSTIAGGAAVVADGLEGTAVRFGAKGTQDARFGRDGQLALPTGPAIGGRKRTLYPRSIAADHRGRVLVFGERIDQSRSVEEPERMLVHPSSAMVLRFTSAGRLNKSFGEGKGYIAGDFGLPHESTTGLPRAGVLVTRVVSSQV